MEENVLKETSGFRETVSIVDDENVRMISVSDGVYTAFAGVVSNKAISFISSLDRASQLLVRAVNNRTRERNYFRKYCELLEEEITEEEFDQEIEEHEDEYVISNTEEANMDDIRLALALCPYLKDVNDVDAMADIFSFNECSIRKSIPEQ